jgi:AAA+ superfamily predicted ATPase
MLKMKFTFKLVENSLLQNQNNNIIILSSFVKNQINSRYIKIGNDNIWEITFVPILKKDEIYLNRLQRQCYGYKFGDQVSIEPYLYLSVSKLKRLTLNVYSLGEYKYDTFISNYEKIKTIIKDVLRGYPLNNYQPFNVKFDKTVIFVVYPCGIQYGPDEIDSNCIIDINKFNDQPIVGNCPIKSWDLYKMGVGGMGDVAEQLFRRAFASRLLDSETVKTLGVKHVKGVLLYGPPGTGKTLIARSIAELLNKSRLPKIVSGPEIFNKFVGESSRNIRDLFYDAEQEQLDRGDKSNLHVIIFDEFDCIGKKRTESDSVGASVGNQIVNQLLVKMDGMEELNNILIIALTNRKEMLDEALLRPGRFEIEIEVKLPTENERLEIFQIHCSKMLENNKLASEINLKDLSKRTKNFTGAEIEGVVKSAVSFAMSRCLEINTSKIGYIQGKEIIVTRDDFNLALSEIHPQFGIQQHKLLDLPLEEIPEELKNFKEFQSLLITKYQTSTVVSFVKSLDINCVMVIDYFDLIGMSDSEQCIFIKNVYSEAANTQEAVVIIDKLDIVVGFEGKYSKNILQTVATLLKYFSHIKTVCTSEKSIQFLNKFFDKTI